MAPVVILGAAAARTKRLLSAANPVRVFQEFATLARSNLMQLILSWFR
jgi:alkanesulfonate monooxygenase SsuD/methylene tetrahydromethanopterin reductase-like flavin-dependent oxidoreductase (luciferase family)